MTFRLHYDTDRITLTAEPARIGVLGRLLGGRGSASLDELSRTDRDLTLALADLRAIAEEHPGSLTISGDTVQLTHRLASALDSKTARTLGLPPNVDLALRTDVEGTLGTPSFRLRHEWIRNGRRQLPQRTGAILTTSDGLRRIPLWLLEAVEVAEGFATGADEAAHWEALARFRQALEPGEQSEVDGHAGRLSMTEFLRGLDVKLADRFSIAPVERPSGLDFEVVPFSGRRLDEATSAEVSEQQGELHDTGLLAFQRRLRARGALSAYRLGEGRFLVIDRSAKPVLDLMARMQQAPAEERAAFIRNPRAAISATIEASLRSAGRLNGLTPAGEEEAIEALAGPVLVETREYSERVIGIAVFRPPEVEGVESNGTTWLPEIFPDPVVHALNRLDGPGLAALCNRMRSALEAKQPSINLESHELPATQEMLRALEVRAEARRAAEPSEDIEREDSTEEPVGVDEAAAGPLILETQDNFAAIRWRPKRGPRKARVAAELPAGIRATLKVHQLEALRWQIAAWKAGLPGVLNADEQGLGKTLQTIAFLRWLKDHMAEPEAEQRGPVLVVAPTSLLETWEAEVATHLNADGLGHLIRLYGSGIGAARTAGRTGTEMQSGAAALDLGLLHEAITSGRGHRFWMLTTYTTLTNYQHSLGRIPFAAIVFDEIQAIKNPVSLRAFAARAMQAEFRIGLTGTPIENSTTDLWAIMDQLAPGALGALKEFTQRYGIATEGNMKELHERLFLRQDDLPPLGLRRLKAQVARDMPPKTRCLHPRLMPPVQAVAYENARLKLAEGRRGSALKMLHHIRSVSVHPSLDHDGPREDFLTASARLSATFDILYAIKARGERALVFIEHRQMQYRFIELARQEFGLNRIDLINGSTPIQQRQAIVNRFQRHLNESSGFDLLVLGPRAAGTGLTLTAATHVIHLSRWWNPAVEEQCNDRVHRIGQSRPVTVHVPMAIHPGYRENSFDCLLQNLMTRKRQLASSALWPMGDNENDTAALQRGLAETQSAASGDPLDAAIAAMFARDKLPVPRAEQDGSLVMRS